jgi:tRNA nucleotidyltransferase/poly(A) polymerase
VTTFADRSDLELILGLMKRALAFVSGMLSSAANKRVAAAAATVAGHGGGSGAGRSSVARASGAGGGGGSGGSSSSGASVCGGGATRSSFQGAGAAASSEGGPSPQGAMGPSRHVALHGTVGNASGSMSSTAAGAGSAVRASGTTSSVIVDMPPLLLTPLEDRIFDVLRSVVKDRDLGLTLRVAGGWVRDKLLASHFPRVDPPVETGLNMCGPDSAMSWGEFTTGRTQIPCDEADGTGADDVISSRDAEAAEAVAAAVDIDIALDCMMGEQFAEHVSAWLVANDHPPASYGVIASNPDQSKHLATARMKILGVWIDLVNLRTETYAEATSRIPDIAIGTPFEDAMRRDLTINALFYNINTRNIEDFTGNGIADVRARIVRTPLLPLTTLLDDPLRALRAIRFASRLNFIFDPELYRACSDSRVHDALGAKVSRERVSSELDSIMSSARPIHAMGLITELSLFAVVFRVPPDVQFVGEARPPLDLPRAALGCLINLHRLCRHRSIEVQETAGSAGPQDPILRPSMCGCPTIAAMHSRIARYAALLAPIASVRIMYNEMKRSRKRPAPLVEYILRSELRMSTKDVSSVLIIHQSSLEFKALVHRGGHPGASPASFPCSEESLEDDPSERLVIGRLLKSCGPHWRAALQTALITELSPAAAADTYARGLVAPDVISGECKVFVNAYAAFERKVEAMGLEGVWDLKPMVDGRELQSLLPKLPRGPLYREIMDGQLDHVIKYPNTSKDAMQDWIYSTYKQFR